MLLYVFVAIKLLIMQVATLHLGSKHSLTEHNNTLGVCFWSMVHGPPGGEVCASQVNSYNSIY